MSPSIKLADYRHVVFFTGAGLSAESGIPTYRGAGGIWNEYRWQDCACQRAFDRAPEQVLAFHELRRKAVLECRPHAGHHHLASLQREHPDCSVLTQNIDGMLQRAGVEVAAELHGSLWRLRCACGVHEDTAAGAYRDKRCSNCGQWLRPAITWFEDAVDSAVFEAAGVLVAQADLFVSIGTSGVVWPAAGFVQAARQAGAHMIEINLESTEASTLFDRQFRLPASRALPECFKPG